MSASGPSYFDSLLTERDACGVGLIYKPVASHDVITSALKALACMEHRGACGADRDSGDGAGILTEIPWALIEAEGWKESQLAAVGVVYMPPGCESHCKIEADKIFSQEGLEIVGWRVVPTAPEVLGQLALSTRPTIEQLLIGRSEEISESELERRLMIARKRLINHVRAKETCESFYIASLSTHTVVYKGMVRASILPDFYLDLQNPLYQSNFAVFHRRFSTNTFPRWALAQPFRMLGHNGEINTLLGNRNWMRAREPVLEQPAWVGREQDQQPVIYESGSDSGNLDNAMEMLVQSGHSPEAALMQLMPEAYRHQPALDAYPQIVDFYDYYSALQEPWDGPALIVYSDGRTAGAILDRNGLRPARYTILKDGSIIVSSEAGVTETATEAVVEKGRLGPGQMIVVDLVTGEIQKNWTVKQKVAQMHPYGQWIGEERKSLTRQRFKSDQQLSGSQLLRSQLAFGYGKEDVQNVISAMAQTANEPVFSMGDDTPIAVLSLKPRVLFDYFKQRFAQVTNPPIDPLREKLVMSLDTYLGRRTNLLHPAAHAARILHLSSPVLNESELESLYSFGKHFSCQKLSLHFDAVSGDLDDAIRRICEEAVEAVKQGNSILILSDRGAGDNEANIPSLLAVGAVHHHLIREGLRLNCSLVVETGQCWTIHHFACLLGYGAQAICPYLALESVRDWFFSNKIQDLVNQAMHTGHEERDEKVIPFIGFTVHKAQLNYVKAVEDGLLKVISKMGISALMSYIGAQIFECIGLGPDVIRRCFDGTTSRIGGLEISDIERETLRFHQFAFTPDATLVNVGNMNHRAGGEFHGNNPELVRALHSALGLNAKGGDGSQKQEHFRNYSELVRNRHPYALRDLLEFSSNRQPISIDEVEPALDIVRRFCTGGMSLGALSKEAHEVLAVAMNRLGAKSNSGEGGEDPNRYYPIKDIGPDGTSPHFPGLIALKEGDNAASAIRQVASARFGVTPEYLVTAEQLEIKIAQGAKPGEGGQLPGHKVSNYIASLRRAKSGMPLISPPPHHDIYSIEDLAQLIFDLRQVNRAAKISVKLVSQIGIGTVAAGVAKADADIVQISGHDGGTGASPLGSIKSAGVPWELGLAETHQVLLANELRSRVLLRVDGGLRSGWEVVIAAMLGADEYGFGSIALIAEGCIMARICHTNNCPVGITSQKESLRKRFPGTPEPVVEFFLFIAEEVRHTLAQLGYCSLSEVIGQTQLLKARDAMQLDKVASLKLDFLLKLPVPKIREQSSHAVLANPPTLDDEILKDVEIRNAIDGQLSVSRHYDISNTDRAIGAQISGEIARQWGDSGFQGQINLHFKGSAGQSFGAFNIRNLILELTGEANDYVGKGMNGGRIVVRSSEGSKYNSWDNVIVGNTCLYGATGGAFFAAGQAGERFAVRNSGALAVIEGAGDHCCEYMTGGTVVILGRVGRNFAAGMTGGLAYVLDEENALPALINSDEGKRIQRLTVAGDGAVKYSIEQHYALTGSRRAQHILANWNEYNSKFWQVVPPAEAEHVDAIADCETGNLRIA